MDRVPTDIAHIIFAHLNVDDIISCSTTSRHYHMICKYETRYDDHLRLCRGYYDDKWLPEHSVLEFHILHAKNINNIAKICSKRDRYGVLLKEIMGPRLRYEKGVIGTIIQNSDNYDNIKMLIKYVGYAEIYGPMIAYCNNTNIISEFVTGLRGGHYHICAEAFRQANYQFIKSIIAHHEFAEYYLVVFFKDQYCRIWKPTYRNIHSLLYEYVISDDTYFTEYVNGVFLHFCECEIEWFQNSILNDIQVLAKISQKTIFDGIMKCIDNKDGMVILRWLNQMRDIFLDLTDLQATYVLAKALTIDSEDMIIYLMDLFSRKVNIHAIINASGTEFSETGVQFCYDFLDYSKLNPNIVYKIIYKFMYRDIRFLMKYLNSCPDVDTQIKALIQLLHLSTKGESNTSLNPILSKMLYDRYV